MRRLLTVLGAIGLVIVIVGAVNNAVDVRVDYLLGTSSDVSLFWFALAVAIMVVAAGFLGILAGRAAQAGDRRKLEKELEDTYRRLREAQAAAPAPLPQAAPEPSQAQTAIAAESVASQVAAPTVIASEAFEPATTVEPGAFEPDTKFSPPRHEAETGVVPPVEEPHTMTELEPLPPAPPPDQWSQPAEASPPAEHGQTDPEDQSGRVQPPFPPA